MTYQEAKKAFKTRAQVKLDGIIYERINAIIFRKTEIETIELELQAIKANSITIAKMEQVECI